MTDEYIDLSVYALTGWLLYIFDMIISRRLLSLNYEPSQCYLGLLIDWHRLFLCENEHTGIMPIQNCYWKIS